MPIKPIQHEIDRRGKRLLRNLLEPLGWVINDVEEDYGIDSNVQIFEDGKSTGDWFHVQLKSSAASEYASAGTFVSQDLTIDHARHYALELRQPILLIHADVAAERLFWHAPQLDQNLRTVLSNTKAKFVTIRIPTKQQLPDGAAELLLTLNTLHLVLAGRELAASDAQSFSESISHFPDQERLYRAFQQAHDTLKLKRISSLYRQRNFSEARSRAEAILTDPDSDIESKFWAQTMVGGIRFSESVNSGKPAIEASKAVLDNAKALQRLTARGPKHLKFHSLIVHTGAELELLAFENVATYMALKAHLREYGNPMMALHLYARRTGITRRIVAKYNQCVRLARYASNYSDRWMLGRALTNLVRALGAYLITARSEGESNVESMFVGSALQISKLAARICIETGDTEGICMVILATLSITCSRNSEPFRWARQLADALVDEDARSEALRLIERTANRWEGKSAEGDYEGDLVWQAIQNVASGLGVDLTDENSPLVAALRIAARDDSPERVLRECEYLLVSRGATGPMACEVQRLFNTSQSSSKVINCTLHNLHVERRELDEGYRVFKAQHCDKCTDKKPRPEDWEYTEEFRKEFEHAHRHFVRALAGTRFGFRYSDRD